jgi:hypothetical protein
MDHNKYKRKRNVPKEEEEQDDLMTENKPPMIKMTCPSPENLKRKRQAPQLPGTIRRTSKRKKIRVVTPNPPPTKIPKRVIEPLSLYEDDDDDERDATIIEPIDIFQMDASYQENEMYWDEIDAEIARLFGSVNDDDVLLGRGGKSNHHAGNLRFLAEVGTRKSQYMNCTKQEKTNLSQSLVDWVQQQGGRFLEKDNSTGTWEKVENLRARKKCSQALREADEK